jgi:threonine aldolase
MSTEPGCQFASDNTAGVCPEAIEALLEANRGYARPYGEDAWTERAANLMREIFEVDCDVFFTFNGTAANSLSLAALCQSYHSVITHELAHIETDECGGPEFFSNGTKLLLVRGDLGRIDVDQVATMVRKRTDIHFPKPKVLSITQSTELGTVYDQDALDRVDEVVRRFHLNLHMDGARFANAVATLGVPPKEITWKRGVDVLCFGGTKNGMPIGECVVFFDRALSKEFAYRCKQSGQLASKMRYLSAPWVGLLADGAWLRNARHANAMALRLAAGLSELAGVSIVAPVESNAVFVDFPPGVVSRLHQMGWVFYEFIGPGIARLMCSWATKESEVERFLNDARAVTPLP